MHCSRISVVLPYDFFWEKMCRRGAVRAEFPRKDELTERARCAYFHHARESTVEDVPSLSEPVAHAAADASEIPVAIEAEIAGIDIDEQPPEQTQAGAGAGRARHPRLHD